MRMLRRRGGNDEQSLKAEVISILSAFLLCLVLTNSVEARTDTADHIEILIQRLNKPNIKEQREAALELGRLKDPRATRSLVSALRSDDFIARRYAALALGEIKDVRTIEALRQALGDKDKGVVSEVKSALRGFGKAAEATLVDALKDKDPRVGWRAAELLGFLKNPAGAKNLLEAVDKGSPHERAEALKILSVLREKKALKPLINALVDKEKDVVKNAQKSLSAWVSVDPSIIPQVLQALKQSEDPNLRVELIGALQGVKKSPVTDILVDLSRHGDARIRQAAIGALGMSANREFLPILLKAMEDKDPSVRKSAAFGLGQMRATEAIDSLIQLLRREAGESSSYAAGALARIGSEAIPKITPLLREKDEKVRSLAARILGDIGDPAAFKDLIASVKDDNSKVRAASVRALGRLGDQRAFQTLINALKGDDPEITEAARYALVDMGDKAINPLIKAFKESEPGLRPEDISQILVEIGPPSLGPLEELWRTGDIECRLLALSAIARVDDERGLKILETALNPKEYVRIRLEASRLLAEFGEPAVNLLLTALHDPTPRVRKAVVDSLGEIEDAKAVKPLVDMLSKDVIEVRQSILITLGKIGSRDGLEAIISQLSDKNSLIRAMAADALGGIGDRQATPHLIKLLSDGEVKVRVAVVGALEKIKDPSATVPLVPLLYSNDVTMRRLVAGALGQLGDKGAVSSLIRSLKDSDEKVRESALLSLTYSLQRIKKGEVVLSESEIQTLVDLMSSPEEPTRIKASLALEFIGPQASPLLMNTAKSGDKRVRLAAISTLGAIGDKQATPLLLDLLRKEADLNVQEGVLISLGRIADPKALTPVIKKLSSKNWSIRAAAAFALGRIGDTRAVAGLMTLLDDEAEKVRKNVREALEAIVGESCPLLVVLTPFRNADLLLFIIMIGLVVTPTIRSWVSPFDLIMRRVTSFLRFFSKERVKWWLALILAIVAMAVFVYCVYCEIIQPTMETPSKDFLPNLYLFALKVFPFFIGGSLISGIVLKYFSQKWRLPKSMFGACILGAILPICSCGVVPLARAMMALDIPKRTVIAFLVVTPILNPFVIFLSYGVIGIEYTILRVVGTFALAIAMGLIIERAVGAEETDETGEICKFCKSCASPSSGDSNSGLINGWRLMGLLYRYIIIGTILGAAMATYMPMGMVTKYLGSDIFGLIFAVTVGIPLYLCSGEEVIMLKPLLDLGLPMGHAVAFTIAANGICITSIAVLLGALGRKTTVALVILFWVLSFLLGYLINMVF